MSDGDAIPDDLAEMLADLPAEIPPLRDLWEGVEDEIEPTMEEALPPPPAPAARPSGSRSWFVTAGLLLVALTSPLVGAWVVASPDTPARAGFPTDAWEADVRASTAELHAILEARRHTLPAARIEAIERALSEFDAATVSVREALPAEGASTVHAP